MRGNINLYRLVRFSDISQTAHLTELPVRSSVMSLVDWWLRTVRNRGLRSDLATMLLVLSVLALVVSAVLFVVPFSTFAWKGYLRPIPAAVHGPYLVGGVSSESDLCSSVGAEFLKAGGNAADAVIGTALCLGVVAPYHTGAGGGGYALVRNRKGEFETIDFKEVAPAAATKTMFVDNEKAAQTGGLAPGVPSELRGLEMLHQRHASLPWADLLRPSIKLATEGFTMTRDLHNFMRMNGQEFLHEDPSWAVDFAPNGTLKGQGDVITRARYGATLKKVSEQGADAFYHGEIASATIRAIHNAGGVMSLQDLRDCEANIREPIRISYRDYQITADAVPAGGPQTLSILKTIEGYNDVGEAETLNLSTHRLVEAMRFSYGERILLGDPLFNYSVYQFADEMIGSVAAKRRRDKMSNSHTLDPSDYNPSGFSLTRQVGTAGVTAADKSGLTIAFTSTVNDFWGSKLCVPETGVIMNDVMADFANPKNKDIYGLPPAMVNFIEPGKRPIGSMANLIVEDSKDPDFVLAVATAGGSQIVTTGVQILWHILDGSKSSFQAVQEPRFHDQVYPNNLQVDSTIDARTLDFLKNLGHNITTRPPGFTVTQIVLRKRDGSFEAVSEPTMGDSGARAV